jgi:diguanylate cyclase (GGDEF)-like protein
MNKSFDAYLSQSNLPPLPEVAQKLVTLRVGHNTNRVEFLRVLESDPILASRILRVANSTYEGIHHKVTTLDHAVATLGINYVRSLALGFELVTSLSHLNNSDLNLYSYWQQTIYRSVLAHQLAKRYCFSRREEAFLIALFVDCGIPLLAQIYGSPYTRMVQESGCSPAAQYEIEQTLFEFHHTTAGAALIRYWRLPEILARLIQDHHAPCRREESREGLVQLGQIVYFVANLPLGNFDTICETDGALLDFSRSVFGFAESDFLEILECTRQEYHHIANLFSSFLPSEPEVTPLLIQSKALLNLYYERKCQRFDCEAAVRKLKTPAPAPLDSNSSSQASGSLDEQTGLVGRELLMTYLEHACHKVRSDQTSLTVFLIDLDDFKVINNRYGNAGGNIVLEEVADLLQSVIADKGCIARYGEDEFVMVMLGLEDRNALQQIQYLTEQLRQLEITIRSPEGREKVQLTASIGMVYCEPGAPVNSAPRLLEHADHQMYQVKNNSKDGFSYIVLNAMPSVEPQAAYENTKNVTLYKIPTE